MFCASIENLSVSYGRIKAVEDVSFTFSCGELTAIVGPNGGGKSSILKAILGKVDYRGHVRLCANSARKSGPVIGYVPQQSGIPKDSPVSVLDLMLISEGYMPAWFYVPRKKQQQMIDILELVSAEKLAHRRVGELSGGEQQRVLLACSLNPMPDLLLLDEPVSAVDLRGMELFYEIICGLRHKFHMAIVLVSHDIVTIARHADSMILVDRNVIAKGRPSDIIKLPEFRSKLGLVSGDIVKDSHICGAGV
ncbi:MAG TPA: metal ABC transporter ATP-binding protein [Spirochaetota bacterium]|nr:metal ABC transporter ATP-binding protein [Spirochaetota bacterium]